MQLERFTIKAQEALQEAQRVASDTGHPEIRPLHLLLTLTRQDEGIVGPILQRLGADPRAVAEASEQRLASTARVEGNADVGLARSLVSILDDSEKITREFQDDYLSTEHMLMAMARSRDETAEILKQFGATPDGVLAALKEVRGSARVTDQNPEDKYQALKRYARDWKARPGDRQG
jgi:ATP-dependent Clp protease ATP-binding subunit ClpB